MFAVAAFKTTKKKIKWHACKKRLYDTIVYIFGRIIAIFINLLLLTTAVTNSNNKPNGNEIFSVIYNCTTELNDTLYVYFIFVRIENDERKKRRHLLGFL